jgi:hypothetical protein
MGHLAWWGEKIMVYSSVSQLLAHGLVLGPGISYTVLREVLLEVVVLVF